MNEHKLSLEEINHLHDSEKANISVVDDKEVQVEQTNPKDDLRAKRLAQIQLTLYECKRFLNANAKRMKSRDRIDIGVRIMNLKREAITLEHQIQMKLNKRMVQT